MAASIPTPGRSETGGAGPRRALPEARSRSRDAALTMQVGGSADPPDASDGAKGGSPVRIRRGPATVNPATAG
ncbi:hypothetical protein GCM10010211_25280 [Streptomyces albospinus]|uniref:Uncharacterized protein n=1 Tax=Streptomyces albospinus TaxID=285515 RepID=A0ABQ2UYB8_9ACTN|nr:hypothetical protein GCM10010211_25280 [Streptomyces albospinus]